MPANVDSMAYYGQVPWHGLGNEVTKGVTSEEMIRAAGLDWGIEKRPARGATIDKKKRATRYEIVRLPRNDHEREILLGVVSRRYEPLQNEDAFAFFDPIIEDGQSFFETAGALGDGERVWVLAKMPDAIEIVHGDECAKYLLLSNTHSGQGSVIVKFTAVRVVCQNTLMLSLDDGQPALRVRHSKVMSDRLNEASQVIAAANSVYVKAAELFRAMARVQLQSDGLKKYLDMVFPRTTKQRKDGKWPDRWDHVLELFESRPDLQLEGVRGTLWAAYNAITRFEDYKTVAGDEMDEARLERVWFGNGADVKLKALQRAQEFISLN